MRLCEAHQKPIVYSSGESQGVCNQCLAEMSAKRRLVAQGVSDSSGDSDPSQAPDPRELPLPLASPSSIKSRLAASGLPPVCPQGLRNYLYNLMNSKDSPISMGVQDAIENLHPAETWFERSGNLGLCQLVLGETKYTHALAQAFMWDYLHDGDHGRSALYVSWSQIAGLLSQMIFSKSVTRAKLIPSSISPDLMEEKDLLLALKSPDFLVMTNLSMFDSSRIYEVRFLTNILIQRRQLHRSTWILADSQENLDKIIGFGLVDSEMSMVAPLVVQ